MAAVRLQHHRAAEQDAPLTIKGLHTDLEAINGRTPRALQQVHQPGVAASAAEVRADTRPTRVSADR
jgi:hypothetical protein